MTTYSIRLGESEKALLTRVLEAKGWTATHFIRQATLEKAAHLDNTRRLIKFDFDGLARRLAKQLCDPGYKVGSAGDPEGALVDFSNLQGLSDYAEATTDPPPLTTSDVKLLREARHLGGSEFLQKVLDECDRLVARQRHDLPDPVDPLKLG